MQQRCSVCGDPMAAALSQSSEDGSAVAARDSTCIVCTSKLRAPDDERGTTILRPVGSIKVGDKMILSPAEESTEDEGAIFVSRSRPVDSGVRAIVTDTPRNFGSYDIINEVSRGSFGVVYRAKQQGLDRVVALKVLLAGMHASGEAVARFHREARAVARLKHPNIVPIYDIGTHGGHHYFAMEFVDGQALSTAISERKISTPEALAITEFLADALESAHVAGVIHRDIKPSNILLDRNGQPHITDFGLAKQIDLDTKYTMSGTTLGTPAYMPPEQARGEIEKIDARSDVYALGAVLYELLTGQTPFAGRSLLEVVVAVINEPVQPPRQLNPKIHRDVQTIVMKCLEKDPRLRYASAAELRDDISRFRSGEAIRARPAGFLRIAGRLILRHGVTLVAALFMLGTLIAFYSYVQRSRQLQQRVEEQKKQLEIKAIKKAPVWRVDWWFPPRLPAELGTDELRKRYKIPENKEPSFQGLVAVKDERKVPELQGKKQVKVPFDALTSPEDIRFFGDIDADFALDISAPTTELKFRVGFHSVAKGYDGIPYLLEITNGNLRLIGPAELYGHTTENHWKKRLHEELELKKSQREQMREQLKKLAANTPDAQRKEREIDLRGSEIQDMEERLSLRLEVKAECEAPPLETGRYTLNIHREGMLLRFQLTSNNASTSLEIRDINLSNWVFKNTQIVVRNIPPKGIKITSGEVRCKYGGDEEPAFRHFREGDYNAAEVESKHIIGEIDHSETRINSEDWLRIAGAYSTLGLIEEICQPAVGRDRPIEVTNYADALSALDKVQGERYASQRQSLARDIHLRLMIRYARNRQYTAVLHHLRRGWPGDDGRIGEPLAWELQQVLEMGLKDLAIKENDKNPGFPMLVTLLQRMGLPEGSSRLNDATVTLAELMLADRMNRAVDDPRLNETVVNELIADLFALDKSYSAKAMNDVFFKTVEKLLAQKQLDAGPRIDASLRVLAHVAPSSRGQKDAGEIARLSGEILKVALHARRYADAAAILRGNPGLNEIVCKNISTDTQAKALADADFNDFVAILLPAIIDNIEQPAQAAALGVAVEKIAQFVSASGRVADLMRLHEALRGPRVKVDPRMAGVFAETINNLAAAGDTGSEALAINLLRYCSVSVGMNRRDISGASERLAQRTAVVDDARRYSAILTIQNAYPNPRLASLVRKVMTELNSKNLYEQTVLFYNSARVEFGNEGWEFTPAVVHALEQISSQDQRTRLLNNMMLSVRNEFHQRKDELAERLWALNFGDILVALNRPDKAADEYQALLKLPGLDTELTARTALRLSALRFARTGGLDAERLLPLLDIPDLNPEYNLAIRLIAWRESLPIEDLAKEMKPLNAPLRLNAAEWDLLRGIRLRLDGNPALARDAFGKAEFAASASRMWVYSVASSLHRARSGSPEDDSKITPKP